MSHDVEIDESRIDASFAAYEAQPEAGPPGQELMEPEPEESGWLATCVFAFQWMNAYAPNWAIPEAEVFKVAEKAALMLDQWFPSGPGDPEKLPPWAQFLVTLGGVVLMYGWDFQNMTLKPLTESDPEEEPEAANEAEAEAPTTPHTTGGRFSTMGASEQ